MRAFPNHYFGKKIRRRKKYKERGKEKRVKKTYSSSVI